MKNDIYIKLNPIERQLRSAQDSNYARLSAAQFEEFCSIYKEQYGIELTKNERNCNICRLKALKKMAKDYFEYQGWYIGRWGRKPEDPKEVNNTKDNNSEIDNEQKR